MTFTHKNTLNVINHLGKYMITIYLPYLHTVSNLEINVNFAKQVILQLITVCNAGKCSGGVSE